MILGEFLLNEQSLVSIIIPNYNYGHFVAEAVASALRQEHPNHEVIVVDDGSNDDSLKILARFGGRIRLVTQANRGPAAARNRGAAIARGEYILFLDSDDLLLPLGLTKLLQAAKQAPGVSLICGDVIERDRTGRDSLLKARLDSRAGRSFPDLLQKNGLITSATLVQKKAFSEAGGFDENPALRVVEDYDLWLRILRSGGTASLLGEPVVIRRVHGENISGNGLKIDLPEEFLVKKWISRESDPVILKMLREKKGKLYQLTAYHARESGQRSIFRQYAWKSCKARPLNPRGWIYFLWSLMGPIKSGEKQVDT